jgi:hypothetical protein
MTRSTHPANGGRFTEPVGTAPTRREWSAVSPEADLEIIRHADADDAVTRSTGLSGGGGVTLPMVQAVIATTSAEKAGGLFTPRACAGERPGALWHGPLAPMSPSADCPERLRLRPAIRGLLIHALEGGAGFILLLSHAPFGSSIAFSHPATPLLGDAVGLFTQCVGAILVCHSFGTFPWRCLWTRYDIDSATVTAWSWTFAHGRFQRTRRRLALSEVKSIASHQSLPERLLGTGRVQLFLASLHTPGLALAGVSTPKLLRRELQRRVLNARVMAVVRRAIAKAAREPRARVPPWLAPAPSASPSCRRHKGPAR